MLTVIFRASARPEVGAAAHVPVDVAVPMRSTVVTTLCGMTGIGPVIDRPDTTCATCLAVQGRHPGKRGKLFLHRQYLETRSAR